jgi:hypothetical protein
LLLPLCNFSSSLDPKPSFTDQWITASALLVIFQKRTSLYAGVSSSRGRERSDPTSIFSSCLAGPTLSFCSGDHPGAIHDAQLMAQAGYCSNSIDYYDGNDVRRFCCERDAVINRYSKATRQHG